MDVAEENPNGAAPRSSVPVPNLVILWVSLIVAIPTVYWSPVVQEALHFKAAFASSGGFISAIAATLVLGLAGPIFIRSAVTELRARRLGRDSLIAFALTGSFGFALVIQVLQWLGQPLLGQDFWWQSSSLAVAAYLGRWFEQRASELGESRYTALAQALPQTVTVITDGTEHETLLSEVQSGDLVQVLAGQMIPVDGVMVAGEALVDESDFTGATAAIAKSAGQAVFAGSWHLAPPKDSGQLTIHELLESQNSALEGTITIQVTAVGSNTLLAQIIRSESAAELAPNDLQARSVKAANLLVLLTFAGAVAAGLFWIFAGKAEPSFVAQRVISVLVVSSPLLLSLSVPAVFRVAAANASKLGILVRSRLAFDALPKVRHLLIDKTGIITKGVRTFAEAHVTRRGGLENVDELLAVAAGLEYGQDHSVAKAILAETYSRGIIPIAVKDAMSVPGVGVSGRWEEHRLAIGGPVLLTRQKIDIDVKDLYSVDALNSAGKTVVFVARDSILLGYIAVSDELNESSADTVWSLNSQGYRVGLITGDAHGVAKHFAAALEISEVFAEVLPADKASVVEGLQAKGELVALAGEAASDDAALHQADISIAIADATRYSRSDADIELLTDDASKLPLLTTLASHARSKTRANLAWAVGFNLFGLLLAGGVLAAVGTVLIPAVSVALSSFAVIITWLNAKALEGKK